jgi:hypothetical protein
MAQIHDLLPALAVRCHEQGVGTAVLGEERAWLLKQALMDNTQRNMKIKAQVLKLTRSLNSAGITPLILKGSAGLLTREGHNIGFRKQIDIDLIVRPEELEAAGDAFLADGYRFYQFPDSSSAVPIQPADTASAIKLSAAHHHLPPLVKDGYAATVELHNHHLPSRFQRNNPLEPLFDSAHRIESHGAAFQVASRSYQLIHLILGKFVHDGHQSRRTFPIREACDLIQLYESAEGEINQQLVLHHCGDSFPLFHGLVCELMILSPQSADAEPANLLRFIRLMQKRFESQATSKVLDAYARADHLAHSLIYSPAKLSAYLRRFSTSP